MKIYLGYLKKDKQLMILILIFIALAACATLLAKQLQFIPECPEGACENPGPITHDTLP